MQVGGTPLCSFVSRLAGGAWEVLPNLLMPRAHAAVVSAGGRVPTIVQFEVRPWLQGWWEVGRQHYGDGITGGWQC